MTIVITNLIKKSVCLHKTYYCNNYVDKETVYLHKQ